jgi:hypothetical protein
MVMNDSSAAVRRELAIALRHSESSQAAKIWATLATQHDGSDRWYLEALGIAADNGHADEFFAAWLEAVGENWNTPAGRDIVWRSRAGGAVDYLVKILQDPATPADQHARYMRAFDFHSGAKKDAALQSLLGI